MALDDTAPKPTLPKTGNDDIPDAIAVFYPSELDAKKIKKPLMCYLLELDEKSKRATLVTKPIKVKYGEKWFTSGKMKYFINYSQVMNFGKHYAYLCRFGNAVGALSFFEYKEYSDANQVLMMTDQHAVEVMKRNKGISQKTAILLVVIAMIGMIIAFVAIQFAFGANSSLTSARTQNTNLINENNALKAEIAELREGLGVMP